MVHKSLVRPAWSAGTADASPIPVSWHIRQLSRPSSGCGVAIGPAGAGVADGVGAGLGVGAGAGAGAVVGAGVGAVAGAGVDTGLLEHDVINGTTTNSTTDSNQIYFFMIFFISLPPLLFIG